MKSTVNYPPRVVPQDGHLYRVMDGHQEGAILLRYAGLTVCLHGPLSTSAGVWCVNIDLFNLEEFKGQLILQND